MIGFHPRDTSIILGFYDVSSHNAKEGPGWYVRATQNEGYQDLVPTRKVSPSQAEGIARAIDSILYGTTESHCFFGVRSLNQHLRDRLAETVEQLERNRTTLEERLALIKEIDDLPKGM